MFSESRLSNLPPRPELVELTAYDTEPVKDLEMKCDTPKTDMSMKTKYSPLKVKPA